MNTKFFPQWLRLTAVLVLLLAALAPVSFAYADSCLVTTNADSGTGSLREMIANPFCDTINFDGDYTILLASQLFIERNVTIDGTGYSITVSGNNAVRVFEVNSGVTFNLQNLIVANGNNADFGGGIYNYGGTIMVTNSTFTGNYAAQGGGINNTAGMVTVTNSTFTSNRANHPGGGIYNAYGGTANVMNSTFSGNSANFGGGIYSDGSTVTVTDSDFSTNSALSGGGGIYSIGGAAAVTSSTFTDNSANFGGGIASGWNATVTLTVKDSTFSGNNATTSGGGIYNAYVSTTNVTNSTFSNNSAGVGGGIANSGTLDVTTGAFSSNSATYGGGIYNANGNTANVTTGTFSGNSATYGGGIYNANGSTTNVTNSTFSDNTATTGGGIENSGTANVTNNTFSGNSASSIGGGIYNYGTADVTNSTFSGNSAGWGSAINNNYGSMMVRNTIVANSAGDNNCYNYSDSIGGYIGGPDNLTDDLTCGGFTNSSSILLGPLAHNGGSTQTMALLPGSAAIDAGDDSVCPGTDQRGVTRPQGAHCDIGAYELGGVIPDTTPPTITLTTPPMGVVYLLGQTVNADYACQDEPGGSGLASCGGTVSNGSPIDTASIGDKTFNVNAADNAGNVASVAHNYQVIYDFTGFMSPIENPPVLNIAKAGKTIPLKWRITDANGNPVTDLADVTVTVVSFSCPPAPTTSTILEYVTNNSGLQNLGDGYYQWNWKSLTSYANSCQMLMLDLGEGAGFEHLALFQFKK